MVITDNKALHLVSDHFVLLGIQQGKTEFSVDRNEIYMMLETTYPKFKSYMPFIIAYIQQNPLVQHTKVYSKNIIIYYKNKEEE